MGKKNTSPFLFSAWSGFSEPFLFCAWSNF
jgi:hypothetical protein